MFRVTSEPMRFPPLAVIGSSPPQARPACPVGPRTINQQADFARRLRPVRAESARSETGVRPGLTPGRAKSANPFIVPPSSVLRSGACSREPRHGRRGARRPLSGGAVSAGHSGQQPGSACAIPSDGTQGEDDCGGAEDAVITAGEGRRFRPARTESARSQGTVYGPSPGSGKAEPAAP